MKRWTVILLAGVAAPAAAAPSVGMNGHLPSSSDLDGMASLGVTTVRMDFNWFQLEPSAGVFDFAPFDAAVDGANARGIGVYATIAYTPQWASSVPACVLGSSDSTAKCENKLPANTSDWTSAVTAIVSRYRGKVACWAIWNEPNLLGFFDGSEDAFVTQVFEPAVTAVRAADPNSKICGPDLSGLTASSNWNGSNGVCAFGQCIRNGWELDLGQMLDRVGGSIDVVTQHMYEADAPSVMGALLDGSFLGTLMTHDSVQHVIASHGAGGKPFWLTESGWEHQPTGSLTTADVATRIVALFEDQEQVCAGTYAASTHVPWSQWQRTLYYHYPYDPNSGWGIIDADAGPLPPYTALQAWAAGRSTSACTGVPTFIDAGVLDAGARADAGTTPDAGAGLDSGTATAADSGANAPDASAAPPPDAGSSAGMPAGGCACGSAPGTAVLWAALLGLALAARRSLRPTAR